MGFQIIHNPLIEIEEMGFAVTWKLMDLGLDKSMDENVDAFLTLDDVIAYLKNTLGEDPRKTDAIISVLCEDKDLWAFRKKIRELAQEEQTDRRIQLRKWRAYALNKLLEEIENDPNGHSELIWFWSTGLSLGECPVSIPKNNPQEIWAFYSKEGAQKAVEENKRFLDAEMKDIITQEVG